jgi:pyridinium-3,5-bisthiocarboxylic acid mononucleotide nickel chelatase
MLLAALLDAGASLDAVRAAVEAVLPGRFHLEVQDVRRGGIRGLHLSVLSRGPGAGQEPSRLAPRPFGELASMLDGAPLSPGVAASARSTLDALGVAEARVHGIDRSDLTLHELGDDDTLLDLVGVGAALEDLAVERILVSPVPLGSGPAPPGRHGHGRLPLPATVTLELLRGFSIRGEGHDETVTPTAAAMFAALGSPATELPAMELVAVGYGAGTDDPPDRPNLVRVLVGDQAGPEIAGGPAPDRTLILLEANLDDLTPELVSDAAAALLSAGALDVWTTSVHMKKGRPGVILSALVEPPSQGRLSEVFFRVTSTFGVRASIVRRAELERRVVGVSLADGDVRVKIGLLDGRVVTASPEHDDVAAVAQQAGRTVREVYEEALGAARAVATEEGLVP